MSAAACSRDGGDHSAIGGIGNDLGGIGSGYGRFDGQIAIARLYDRALTTGEVRDNYTAVTGLAAIPEPTSLLVLAGMSITIMRRRR